MKIPLAWLQLTREKVRFLVALAGISFADLLMFMQLGFKTALLNSAVRMHQNVEGDVFLLSPQSMALISMDNFSSRRLYEALSVEGVKSVTPMYVGFANWKNPVEKNTRQIMVIGVNPKDNIFDLPGLEQNFEQIKLPDVMLFDDQSRPEYGEVAQMFNSGKEVKTELANRQIKIGGLFSLGTTFGADGNIITSDLNFLRLFPNRDKGLIDIGVIRVKPDTDIDAVIATLKSKLNEGDVLVLSRDEFVNYEREYWETSTAVGFVFGLGTVMGLIVGTVIVYQILYTDVADHLPEYATLKAMGYSDTYLLVLVFQQAIILACIGFIPGLAFSTLLYQGAANATGLPIFMTKSLIFFVYVLTLLMCCFSGAIAVSKLKAADPADIF